MNWDEEHAAWEERWDSTFDSEDPLLSVLTDKDILGVCDGYDDYKLDTIFEAFVRLRRMVQSQSQPVLWERFG